MKTVNENRIVRLRNERIHKIVNWVSLLTDTPYQVVFDELCQYLIDGHIIGTETHLLLMERVLVSKHKD